MSEATKEKIRLSREANRERCVGQFQPTYHPSSGVTEEELEAYHKGNYSSHLAVVPLKEHQRSVSETESRPDVNQREKIVTLYCSIELSIYDQIVCEAEIEGRSVPAHIAWLIRCLYNPPAMVSSSRARDIARSKIHENI